MKRADPYYLSREWRALREQALQRDGCRCVIPGCGRRAVRVDHIVARRDGGADMLDNLRSLCAEHDNQVKEDATGKRRSGGKLTVKGCYPDGSPRDPASDWHRP